MKPVKLPENKSTKDKLLEIAKTLKAGQGIPVSEVCAEIGVDSGTIRKHGKSLGCYTVINNIAYVTCKS